MRDDKKKIGAADRRTVSEAEDYELRYFARKHNIRGLSRWLRSVYM
jgi:hypothetical protein